MPVTAVNRNHVGGCGGHRRLAPLVAPPGHHGEIVADSKGKASSGTDGFDVGLCRDRDVALAVEILPPGVEVAVFGQGKAVGDRGRNIFEEERT